MLLGVKCWNIIAYIQETTVCLLGYPLLCVEDHFCLPLNVSGEAISMSNAHKCYRKDFRLSLSCSCCSFWEMFLRQIVHNTCPCGDRGIRIVPP
jgi:hypothetical protein